jgi:epoxyqueuosine reductase
MKKCLIQVMGTIFIFSFFILGLADVALAADEDLRSALKIGSAIAAVLSIIGIAIAGYFAGKSYDSHTGWERYHHGAGQFYNRRSFRQDKPTYGINDTTQRLNWIESLPGRMAAISGLMKPSDGSKSKWMPPMGMDALPEPIKGFFKKNERKYKLTLEAFELIGEQKKNWPKFENQYVLADAWSSAHGSIFGDHDGEFLPPEFQYPPEPQGPPEEWDYRDVHRDDPLPFKSSQHAAELMKKITHTFGATLVGITKLNPDWCYQGHLRGVGEGDWEVPKHWEYAIVWATPHEWDSMYCNPNYGTSYDAYSRNRIIGGKLESFIHELGYPARAHVPPMSYDLVTPPIAIDAGLGEIGRHGILITPELGSNSRLGVVTTNIPMAVDKPVNLGIMDFCKKCKICAKTCPSGAISIKDTPETVRGYRRWRIRDESCFQTWASVAQRHVRGCRICLAVCPYSRKNNWVHALSRYVDPRDPTGISASVLLWMQKKFFDYPKAHDFMPPPSGKNASYHEPPDWLQTDKWFDIPKTW